MRPYFGEGDECHMAFHFPLMPRIYMALRQEDRLPITDIMAQTPPIPDSCQWGLFLRNHDELTLEMVTDDERDYMYFAYSADPRMRVNVGIRRRLAPLVDNNRRRIELLNSILLSFPGTPILYYGDEIGMGDNIYLGDRNGVRTPMQWTSDRNAGFSRCDPARLYFPVIMDPIYGYQVVNVEAQQSDPSSLLHWTRNMIALRKLFQVFGRGSLTFLNPANRKVLAYLRDMERSDGSHETVLCVANLSRFAQPVSLDLALFSGMEPVEMLGYVPFPTITEEPYSLTLAPYSFLWLELQPAKEVFEVPPEAIVEPLDALGGGSAEELDLLTHGWSGWLASHGFALLATALPEWMRRQRWYGAKSRTIQSAEVLDWVELADSRSDDSAHAAPGIPHTEKLPVALLFVEIHYDSGPSDLYQLPLAISVGNEGAEVATYHPSSVIATFNASSGAAVVHDATILEDTRQRLLALIERNATLPLSANRIPAGSTAMPATDLLPSVTGAPVAPVPISAQPGEAAAPPRSTAPAPSAAQRIQPRESPSAGNPLPSAGRLDAHASSLLQGLHPLHHEASRIGTAEQSNTSILYGHTFILKLFRRLQPGENPDVEIGRFLTEVARFQHIAPFMGEVAIATAAGEATTTAVLQGFMTNEGDGWEWNLDQLGGFLKSVEHVEPPLLIAQPTPLRIESLNAQAREFAQTAIGAASLLGQRTAEMHLALDTPTQDQAFRAETFGPAELEQDVRRIETQLLQVVDMIKSKLATLDDAVADLAVEFLSRRREFFGWIREMSELKTAGQRIRTHGDYHLGQILRTSGGASITNLKNGDFVILDFEGEPARTLAERRQKQSPLKDVAGMTRSFSYAAHAGLERVTNTEVRTASEDIPWLATWARCWERSVVSGFLRSYSEHMSAKPELLPPQQQSQILLKAYMLEKALYEVMYELNNRPRWVSIPLAGILAL